MQPATKIQFKIRGMDCAEEIAILKREIGPRGPIEAGALGAVGREAWVVSAHPGR